MYNCKYLQTEDITPWRNDVYDHPKYNYTCKKCTRPVIPFIHCNEDRCESYTPLKRLEKLNLKI